MYDYTYRLGFIFLLVVLPMSWFFLGAASDQESDDPVQETLKVLLNGRSCYPSTQRQYDAALKRAKSDFDLRDTLVEILRKRLKKILGTSARWSSESGQEVDLLRKLDGNVALPLIKEWWDRPDRNSVHESTEELQLQMLNALSEWLPVEEQVPFLIDIHIDIHERPRLRLEAILLLCKNGSEEAVKHVIATFQYNQELYHNPISPDQAWSPENEPWDIDGDGLSDYFEPGLLLDPTNPDTDGDLIIDGFDLNPLLNTKETPTPEQIMARYLVYLHVTYNVYYHGPFDRKIIILPTTVNDEKTPSLLGGIEFTGVPAKFLHLTDKQYMEHHSLIGWGAHLLSLKFVKDLGPDRKEYSLDDFYGNTGGEVYRIVVKRCKEVWLPVEWVITDMS